MNFVEVLKECESAGGAGSKNVIKEALAKLDAESRRLMRYAMDPYMTFGTVKYIKPDSYAQSNPADIAPLFRLFDDLAARNLTGTAAKGAIGQAFSNFTKETAAYLEKVLDKDPRAGFSVDTYNKIWPTDPIPSWDQQLAEKFEEAEEFEEKVVFPAWADVKYDGNRSFAFVREGQPVEYRARGGKLQEHLAGQFDDELQAMREYVGYDFVLDGEVMGKDFTETQNAKKTGNDAAKANQIFRSFFIMPITDWIAQKTTITNAQARAKLEDIFSEMCRLPVRRVLLTEGRMVKDYHDMMAYCDQVTDDETKTKAEREGLIIKQGHAVYEWGRSTTWIKVKRFYDVDARFTGFYAARPKTRLAALGLPGGVNCIAFLENGTEVRFNVGSGFSHDDRRKMLSDPDFWLKNTHVVKYQEVSKAKGKEFASLRFCTYERTRDDKHVEI